MIQLDTSLLQELYGDNLPNLPEQFILLREILAHEIKQVIVSGKVSRRLFEQLLNFQGTRLTPAYKYVLREILALENGSGAQCTSITKEETALRGGELRGLYKKHFFVPSLHMGINMMNVLKLNNDKSQVFECLMKQAMNKYSLNEESTDETRMKVSKSFTNNLMEMYDKKKKTGDWLIFVKYQDINYYLCIVPHRQSQDDDIKIRKTCDLCIANEFPFLSNIFI